jgi:hypothetical protein
MHSTGNPERKDGMSESAAANGRAAITVQQEHDLLAALASEYQAEWKVWKPGNYVADHRKFDVELVSDSVAGLAEKLRVFTELVKDLPC